MFRALFSRFKKSAPRKRLKDPVCGMEATDAISFEHKGQTHFFCSDHCRAQYEREPERFAVK